jgi:hypothetical protein
MQKFIFTFFISTFLCFNTALVQAQPNQEISIKEVLKGAMEQQVLSQQIAKIYFALFDNVSEPTYYVERDKAISDFEQNLAKMKLLIPNNRVRESLKKLESSWDAYKKIAAWSINKEGAESLLEQVGNMELRSKETLQEYERYAQETGDVYQTGELSKVIESIKRVANQKTLTYQLTYTFIAMKHEIGIPVLLKKQLEEYSNAYDFVLYDLSAEEVNSKKINNAIVILQQQWGTLSGYFKNMKEDAPDTEAILKVTTDINLASDALFELYRELGRKLAISETINTVSYQGMLSQRIAKSYVAIANNHQTAKYKREINISVNEFEARMTALIKAAANEPIKRNLQVMQTMWKNYKKMTTNWTNIDGVTAGKVLEKSFVIMATCDQVAQAVENYALTIPEYKKFASQENNMTTLVKTIGKQRMYTQQIAIYFMFCAVGQDTDISRQRLKGTVASYEKGIDLLVKSAISANDATISYELGLAAKDWKTIQGLWETTKKDDIPFLLEVTEKLVNRLDVVSNLLEAKMDQLLIGQQAATNKP